MPPYHKRANCQCTLIRTSERFWLLQRNLFFHTCGEERLSYSGMLPCFLKTAFSTLSPHCFAGLGMILHISPQGTTTLSEPGQSSAPKDCHEEAFPTDRNRKTCPIIW
jgi:hypothetical protein